MNEQLKIIISAEVDKLKKAVNDAKGTLEDLKAKGKISAEDIDNNFKKAGDGINNAMKTASTAIAGAVAALGGVAIATKEYQANQAKLTAAFETAGGTAKTAKETYNDLYRVLGESDTAVEAANHLAKLTTNQKELEQWTNICQGVFATFGDSLPIEGLTEAANETAKVGTVTGGLADALNWAGISEDAFNEKLAACATEQEREKLIRETLNGVYSEAAANYEKTAAEVLKQNEAQAKLEATLAAVGSVMMPVLTAFTSFGAEALAVVLPYVQQLAQDLLPTLKTILEGVVTALQATFEWATQHKEVLAAVAIVIGTVAAAITLYNTVAAVKAAMAALEVTSVWGLVAAYAAQAAAMALAIAPYVLVVAAIAAVVAAIVLCIKNWDKIKAKVKEVWSDIKKRTTEAVDNVVKKYNELKEKAVAKVTELKTNAVNKFNEIKSGIVQKAQEARAEAVAKFEALKSGAIEKFNNVKSKATSIFNSVTGAITKPVETAKTKVKAAIDKIRGFFDFKWSLPKLKMPSIDISGKFSLNPPQVPKFSISWNALGGVFDKPTLFSYGNSLQGLGENGAEAVVPLEKNTQWLDRLASMLAEKQGGNRPIILQVDGKTFAQTSIDSINALTKQKGKLGLNLL